MTNILFLKGVLNSHLRVGQMFGALFSLPLVDIVQMIAKTPGFYRGQGSKQQNRPHQPKTRLTKNTKKVRKSAALKKRQQS